MVFLYDFFIQLYVLAIRIAGTWNKKAALWTEGRKKLFEELQGKIHKTDRIIWLHCASAGEFEQGKPVIEQLKKDHPTHKILVSFFSPSGFAAAKKYAHADILTYLPADSRKNAKRFIAITRPELVVFIKYEYWYHHLAEVAFHHIPLLLVSAIFRKEQVFFKWYGKFYRQMLFLFRQIFVQDETSLELLRSIQVNHCMRGGDTRFDRVKEIAGNFSEIPLIREFSYNNQVIVAGSTWHDDEKLFAGLTTGLLKLIIAPHEVNREHILQIKKLFPEAECYSALEEGKKPVVLIIDSFGMLSRLYQYSTICYIGGGFNKSGIHNTLEAVVYGRPVIFGPHYQKFKEARDLIECGGGFSISNTEELKAKIDELLSDQQLLASASRAAKNYVDGNTGATGRVVQYIQENLLLTR